ncbi:hypothetical protein GCM10011331_05050 [Flavimobilis marinus]|uniref:Uncharacterized protein n=1 Tax=Flavimobilis marinus TaxID=285351 RepID=A0A1I2DDC4_9MICO|nr:hypothetical protein [Flavimobilis marinus]GHG45571.1 hypothetical protein GCM10011331_05050 [Flavimobilis marinus]SFE77960.1 hypothetical protein SAMN04488035_0492 [Flavimobilis marinus]
MSTTPHPDPDPSDRTEPRTQPIGTTGAYAGSTGGSGSPEATSPMGVPAHTGSPTSATGSTEHSSGGAKDADQRREPRVATIVWGLILVAVAAGVLAVAQGYRIDAELALIVGLSVAGLLLLLGSLATAARRRRRSSDLPG